MLYATAMATAPVRVFNIMADLNALLPQELFPRMTQTPKALGLK